MKWTEVDLPRRREHAAFPLWQAAEHDGHVVSHRPPDVRRGRRFGHAHSVRVGRQVQVRRGGVPARLGPRSNEWNAHRARDHYQSWQRSQLGKRTLETQPIDSDKVECERAAAIAEANEAKRRRMEEQEEALRHAAARAAELAAADEPGAGSTSSQSLAPLFAANSAFLRHDVALVDVTRYAV